jgi:hypothetical protein
VGRLLAIFAVIMLAFAPLATAAQAASCRCDDAAMMTMASAPSARPSTKLPPCCHGKACGFACVATPPAPLPPPAMGSVTVSGFSPVRLVVPTQSLPRSAERNLESPPPKRIA